MEYFDLLGVAALGALAGAISLFVLLITYIYSSFALMTIAKKTKTKRAWLAWIPIANLYLMTQIAKVDWWTMLIVLFASLIPIIGPLVSIAIIAWWWWKIAERTKKPEWLGLLMIIPVINLVVIGILAWAK